MKTKTFFGKKATMIVDTETDTVYQVKFNTKDDVMNYYNEVTENCYLTNFGDNPFEKNAYGEFFHRGKKYFISSPKQSNGDSSWYSYSDESKRYANITLIK